VNLPVADVIRAHEAQIMKLWAAEASESASARGLSRPELMNVMPVYLSSLGDVLADGAGERGEATRHVQSHLASRLRQGFDVAEIVAEFMLLGRCIMRMAKISPADAEQLSSEIERASVMVAEMFAAHMNEDEQAEKRYLRRIQEVASDALHKQTKDGDPEARMREVLEIIREAMGCDSAALLLYDAVSGRLIARTSSGIDDAHLSAGRRWRDERSFAGRVGSSDETMALDVKTTELDIGRELRESGIQAVLAVKLERGYRVRGVLYVGVREQREFSVRESRRLDTLGHWLAVHLDSASLFAEINDKVQQLEEERELRERFVSVLAHDLRGPLTTAKMAATMLARKSSGKDEWIERVDRSVDRLERMIVDLLDANRVFAGEPLPITLAPCDLSALVDDVIDEMTAQHGDRFRVEGDAHVEGNWSASQLRRALENLLSNAVKYGDEKAPITIGLKRSDRGVLLSVHNEGQPIAAEDLETIFQPFSRARAARAGSERGWGLGLALVRGCAEAHGGKVDVDSGPTGTTFTISLPLDSRAARIAGAEQPGGQRYIPS
jgi:signal transduction histidine kinase